jgi:hypothetical protein
LCAHNIWNSDFNVSLFKRKYILVCVCAIGECMKVLHYNFVSNAAQKDMRPNFGPEQYCDISEPLFRTTLNILITSFLTIVEIESSSLQFSA